MERVKAALIRHYRRDKIAFYLEMIGMLFTVGGSALLAITAKNPNMAYIYPMFLVGSITGFVAYIRLEAIWTIVLTGYFIIINTVGLIVVFL